MTATPIDFAHLRQFSLGDPALEAELLGLLRGQIETWLPRLAPDADDEAWTAAAHTLKGAARGVGAFGLGEVCERAEALAGPDGDAGRREEALGEVRRIADTVVAFIDAFPAAEDLPAQGAA